MQNWHQFSVCADVKSTIKDGLIAELSDNFLVRYNEDVDLFTVRHYKHLTFPPETRRYHPATQPIFSSVCPSMINVLERLNRRLTTQS